MNVLNDNLHSAHCRACKERVRALLTTLYGDCRVNHTLPWSALPQDYTKTLLGPALARICSALGDYRGHRDFIKSAQVPPCDYFISDPPFIVEFDESQHFSQARLVTLANYPEKFIVGFSRRRWLELCRKINAEDHQPFDRDERRAWYDSLRDLVPSLYGYQPTVRLYAEQTQWCALGDAARDVAVFCALLNRQLPDTFA